MVSRLSFWIYKRHKASRWGKIPLPSLEVIRIYLPKCLFSYRGKKMASPQIENGYTKIANEIIEALAGIRISGEEMQALWVILRKTYGWNKKEDKISLSQFALLTGVKKPNIIRAIKKLLSKKIIIIKNDNGNPLKYRFNKDFDAWKPLSKKITVIKKDNKSLSKMIPTKETVQKKKRSFVETQKEFQLSKLLLSLIRERKPDFKEPNLQRWAREIDLMIRIDKRKPEKIEKVIRWCQTNDFWQNNILSTQKLRKHYDQLTLKMVSEGKSLEDYKPPKLKINPETGGAYYVDGGVEK